MAVAQHRRAVGVFSNRRDAETALRELRDSNFPMDRVSVITQDADQGNIAGADMRDDVHDHTGNKADEGAATGAATGGALGTLTGLLVGLGALAIPGIGPIMLAGATATAIATTLAGGAIGAAVGSLLGSLIGLGIPEERAKVYHDRISRGHYLVIVEGTDAEIDRAQAILHNRGIEEWGVYDMPNTASTPRSALVHNKRAVGVFPHRRDAETAVRDLREAGFPMSQVSLVVSDRDRDYGIADIDVRDRFDNGLFGFPQDRARFYNDRFDRGEYLVIVDGTEDEVRRAEAIMRRRGIQDWGIFDIPESDRFQRTPRPGYVAAATPRPGVGREHHEGREHRAIGVFPHRRDAEAALTELRDAGFNMDDVSIVGKNLDPDHPIAGVETRNRATGNKADEGAKAGAATGGALGGLGGLLVGLGALAIPGIGPVIAGGALATALATTAAGGAIGAAAGGLTGALVGLGIPEEEARRYNDRVNRGDYLVMIDGTDEELRRAEAILRRHRIQDWGIFDKSDVSAGGGSGRDRNIVRDRDVDRGRPGFVAATTPRPNTGVGREHRAVGVFPHRRDAEAALAELRDAGFDMDDVSIVGKNLDSDSSIAGVETRNRATGNKADDGAKAGAASGAALGGLGGLLVGLGALAIPGIGPVIAGGALATALATTAAGGAIGAAAGGLTGALVGLGIPEEEALRYNDRVNRGDYLVMVDGTDDEIHRAQAILSRHGIQEWGIYDKSDVGAGHGRTGDRDRDIVRDVDRNRPGYATAAVATPTPEITHSAHSQHKHGVGFFHNHQDAENALAELRAAGFPMRQVSLVVRDYDRYNAIPGVEVRDRFDNSLFGFPGDRVQDYNSRLGQGEYMVMVHGTDDDIRRAEAILSHRGIRDWWFYDPSQVSATRQVIDQDKYDVGNRGPEVIIIDRRDETV